MAKSTTLKRRIASVQSTRQITKAMELVAASKLRRAQENAFKSRDYRNLARELLTRLRQLTDVSKQPLFHNRTIHTRLHLLIASDRGLAGAFGSNLIREFTREVAADREAGVATQVIAVGKRGAQALAHIKDIDIIAAYEHFPDHPTANDIRPILNTVIELFEAKKVDAVDIIYTDYRSSLSQLVKSERLLPAAFEEIEISSDLSEAIFEPSPQAVLDAVTLRFIEALLSQAFFESQASEQSMRMLAMKTATDNANDLIDDLRLAYNTARQGAITQELAEITGGAEAIQQ